MFNDNDNFDEFESNELDPVDKAKPLKTRPPGFAMIAALTKKTPANGTSLAHVKLTAIRSFLRVNTPQKTIIIPNY